MPEIKKPKTIDEIVSMMRELVKSDGNKRREYIPRLTVGVWLALANDIEVASRILKAEVNNAYQGCVKCEEHKKKVDDVVGLRRTNQD